jgi:hypothetical protein
MPSWVPNTVDNYVYGSVQHCVWNDPTTINGIVAFVQAAAARYDTDPRFLWAEVGWYGDAREWSNVAATPMTVANMGAIIDAYARYWTHKRIVVMTGWGAPADYALSLSPASGSIGVRFNCLGSNLGVTPSYPGQAGDGGGVANPSDPVWTQWQKAPVVSEYCTGLGSQAFVNALTQVPQFHVSQAGTYSYDSSLDSNGQLAMKEMGNRYVLNSVSSPTAARAGASFSFAAHWANAGVAPTYLPWTVALQLRNPTTGPSSGKVRPRSTYAPCSPSATMQSPRPSPSRRSSLRAPTRWQCRFWTRTDTRRLLRWPSRVARATAATRWARSPSFRLSRRQPAAIPVPQTGADRRLPFIGDWSVEANKGNGEPAFSCSACCCC